MCCSMNQKQVMRNRFGFTLAELSIVLVIIGLVIGGVMVGQELVASAKNRAQISQIGDIETQINTFRVKYDCLPGDCADATNLFGTGTVTYDGNGIGCNNTVCNGNNDGIIKSAYQSITYHGAGECLEPSIGGEVSQLFKQLSLAGFGDYTRGTLNISAAVIGRDVPFAKYGNGTGIYVSCLASNLRPILTPGFLRRGNIIVIGAAAGGSTRIGYSVNSYSLSYGYGWGNGPIGSINPVGIPANTARIIDEKIDDGKPSSGKFGVIAGSDVECDNALLSQGRLPLISAYTSPSIVCDVTVGRKID